MRLLAQVRNPYSRWWLWIPGSRFARPGTTVQLITIAVFGIFADVLDGHHVLVLGSVEHDDALG